MNNRFVSLFVFVTAACGGGDGSGGGTVDVEDPSAFCRAAAETGCETMYTCLTEDERKVHGLPPTVGECERAYESRCEDAVDTCNTTSTAYASDAAGTCLDEMAAATCNDAAEPWLDAPSCTRLCAVTAGSFEIGWTFDPPTYSCSQLGVTTVAVYSVGAGGKTWVDVFDCYIGSGITDALPVGMYSLRMELYNASNQRVWSSPSLAGKLDDDRVDLGTITIPVGN
jgi:hypothetical protein